MAAKGGGVPIWPTTDGQGAVFRCCWGGGALCAAVSSMRGKEDVFGPRI